MTTIARTPAGVPTGGQFAATSHGEATVALSTTAPIRLSPAVRELKTRVARLKLEDIDLDEHVIDAQHEAATSRVNEDGGDFDTEHDAADNAATEINNGGLDAQLTYLADELGASGVDDLLTEAAVARLQGGSPVELTRNGWSRTAPASTGSRSSSRTPT